MRENSNVKKEPFLHHTSWGEIFWLSENHQLYHCIDEIEDLWDFMVKRGKRGFIGNY